MTIGKFRHLPVVEEGKVVGIISIGDVVKYRLAEMEAETPGDAGLYHRVTASRVGSRRPLTCARYRIHERRGPEWRSQSFPDFGRRAAGLRRMGVFLQDH